MNPDIIVKGAMIGDYNVGKSSIFQTYVFDKLNIYPTIGVDYHSKIDEIQGTVIKLNLWDTAGQERFRSIVQVYARGVYVFFLVFDVTQRCSFLNLANWLSFVREKSDGHARIILIANKVDVDLQKWKVSKQEILAFVDSRDDIHKVCFVTSKLKKELYINGQQSIESVFHDTLCDIQTMLSKSPKKINGIIDKRCIYTTDLHTPPESPLSSADVMTSFGFKHFASSSTETCHSFTKSASSCGC